ncbi:elongation of very long chain fatty acids protein AAEL008004-like [Oppia nitens]|uniref:elongation of very long chain fatty acids protein AAEL008004-like n=1 Tax=Oppia nitens TaxID=1686743 RepID=UPI0023DCB034|nr:elongation of very long chain fatty acids protein AAEL008004-like [Oppia nitens]
MLYFYTKLVDLLDTIFFVLRKKSSQITFLHVYHHIVVSLLCWASVAWCPQTVILEVFCLLNSIVHTVMYFYYLLAALGTTIQSYIQWCKPYITGLQLVQFVLFLMYAFYCIILEDMANYPLIYKWFGALQPIVFLIMFSKFFIKSYSKSKSN